MPNYNQPLDAGTLKGAQDWYIRSLKSQMGLDPGGSLANPDGTTDNYLGYKPNAALALTQNLDANGMVSGQQSSYDINLDLDAYRRDPAEWERRARESVKSWDIGGDNNQQYTYDGKSGNFIKQRTKDNSLVGMLSEDITEFAHDNVGKGIITAAATAAGVPTPVTAFVLGAQDGDIKQGLTAAALAYASQEMFDGYKGEVVDPASPTQPLDASAGGTGGWNDPMDYGGEGEGLISSVKPPTDSSQFYNQYEQLNSLDPGPDMSTTIGTNTAPEVQTTTPKVSPTDSSQFYDQVDVLRQLPETPIPAPPSSWEKFTGKLVEQLMGDPLRTVEWLAVGLGGAIALGQKSSADSDKLDENKRQFDLTLDETKRSNDIKEDTLQETKRQFDLTQEEARNKEKRISEAAPVVTFGKTKSTSRTRRSDGKLFYNSDGTINRS